MAANPKLSQAPLVEALFEIRYDPVSFVLFKQYASLISQKLKQYSQLEDLNIPEIPESIPEGSSVARFRFRTEDQKQLYHLGTGVLSINTVGYAGFEVFLKNIKNVLDAHKSVCGVSIVKRMGLRYINRIQSTEPSEVNNILSYKRNSVDLTAPLKGFAWSDQSLFRAEADMMKVLVSYAADNKEMYIDLDYSNTSLTPYDIESMAQWIENAHSSIYTTFKKTLDKKYFEKLK